VAGARRVMMRARTEMRADETIHSLTPTSFYQRKTKAAMDAACSFRPLYPAPSKKEQIRSGGALVALF